MISSTTMQVGFVLGNLTQASSASMRYRTTIKLHTTNTVDNKDSPISKRSNSSTSSPVSMEAFASFKASSDSVEIFAAAAIRFLNCALAE
jgi:hypothetical protein